MSYPAEFWDLEVVRDSIIPTLRFKIKFLNVSESDRFNVLCNQVRVHYNPKDRPIFYLGQTFTSMQTELVEHGQHTVLSSDMHFSPHSMELIEKRRGNNDLILQLKLDIMYINLTQDCIVGENLHVYQKGETQISISRSEWRDLLVELGYQETFVLEVPAPSIKDIPQLNEALDFLRKAKLKFIEGEDMGAVVTNCRQAIDKTIEAIDENIIDLEELFGEASLAERYPDLDDFMHWSSKIKKEIQTIKSFCGPGPHVEVRVTRSEARYALIHTANVLSYLAQVMRMRAYS